ncbi:MAG: ComEA family DNA-binding protein [bacterium]|nr:ComEA family DNA-binding protein [bacterium]MCY3580108.1 ComEA family DNA-binding protein [bacterium]MCY3652713.1 ComEA family DNA-binding protein [bacterium]MDE0643786.1 ComEA family DNA-binding protein [bacterium]
MDSEPREPIQELADPGRTWPIRYRPTPRRGPILVGVLGAVLAVGMGIWYLPSGPPPEVVAPALPVVIPNPDPIPSVAPEPAGLTVHVSGAVVSPGLVVLPEGSRVADAIAEAGGARAGSGLHLVNLARPVTDGMQLIVPWNGENPTVGSQTEASGYPIDLNQADRQTLTRIPGVGEVLAERILTYREKHGPFRSMEDLLDVSGIGEAKLAGMRDYATVNR